MEEIVALLSICLLTGVGWVAAKLCFSRIINDENCIYFAPALGAGICGVLAYVAVHSYQPWLIPAFCLGVGLVAVVFRKRLRSDFFCSGGRVGRAGKFSLVSGKSSYAADTAADEGASHAADTAAATGVIRAGDTVAATGANEGWRLLRFTALAVLSVYGMQIVLYRLFSGLYPAPDEVWSLFNLTGTSPPDQMFAWHQAMFADQHRHYPQDAFYGDMDLYDRPHLGGYITLFIFKLWGLPLTENHWVYPAEGLRFYHCLWWLLNNLYLVGVAPLFRKLFGYRGGIIAVATTALGGFFFICTAGGWMKFAGAYPLLLAFLLYIENRGPVLQAALCAMSYYIHGSVLPFLAGFGLLQVANLRYPINRRRLSLRRVSIFGATSVALVGTWFLVVRLVGSKQPLLYYYLYGAGLTDAQTMSAADIVRRFYDNHTWASLSLLPVRNLLASWLPTDLAPRLIASFSGGGPVSGTGIANASFAWQRFWIASALGVVSAPLVVAGFFKTLARKHAGIVAFCVYLVPTLIIALTYRISWAFSLHILVVYHTFCLFSWVTKLGRWSARSVSIWLALVAAEGIVCVLFAEIRFLPAHGLHLSEITLRVLGWLVAYLLLVLCLLLGAGWEISPIIPAAASATAGDGWRVARAASGKILVGLGIVAAVISIYSIYCVRFYPR